MIRLLEIRDKAAATFVKQLDADEVPPNVALSAVRDMTETTEKMAERERLAAATSVVDEWLAEMKANR